MCGPVPRVYYPAFQLFLINMAIKTLLKTAAAALVLALAAGCFNTSAAQTARGEKAFGPRLGYVSRNESVIAGLGFQYSFSKHVRLAPSVDIIFRHHDKDGFGANADVQFPFGFAASRAAFYPLVGFNFTSWGLHDVDAPGGKDVTTHSTSAGLNAGAGVEYRCKGSLKLSLEARYTLLRHYPTAAVYASIAFVF